MSKAEGKEQIVNILESLDCWRCGGTGVNPCGDNPANAPCDICEGGGKYPHKLADLFQIGKSAYADLQNEMGGDVFLDYAAESSEGHWACSMNANGFAHGRDPWDAFFKCAMETILSWRV